MEKIAEFINANKIRAKKAFGQNFIYNNALLERIVEAANISENDFVIEIGAGIGNLTSIICKYADKVAAVEIDFSLIKHIETNTADFKNVTIYNKDILKIDIEKDILIPQGFIKSKNKVKIVANLPYYITTPIITGLLEKSHIIDSMYFLLQKEVAERIASKPGVKSYGSLTVFTNYYGQATKLFDVAPGNFIPKPDVTSSVIEIDITKRPNLNIKDETLFFNIVRSSFEQRRKTLVNGLNNSTRMTLEKEIILKALLSLDLLENIRGEKLSLAEFANLSNKIYDLIHI